MIAGASPFLHPISVPPHQGADTRVPVLRGAGRIGSAFSRRRLSSPSPGTGRESPGTIPVLRQGPCRAFGVTSPLKGTSLTLRADLAGSARSFCSPFVRIRSCLKALTVCACVFVPCRASPLRLNGIN